MTANPNSDNLGNSSDPSSGAAKQKRPWVAPQLTTETMQGTQTTFKAPVPFEGVAYGVPEGPGS